ncbi:MAG: type II toxin-antitoxin system HicB family antitoxin [Clostridiales bacterium]|nr:type II toxin-antitoxin system HicB family antitoxin [Clostridiales bacterium]
MNNSMLEYKGYHATVEFDADDGIFVGEVFGIADSLNFHGRSVDELEEMFRQSIDNYLEFCKNIGKEPDREFRGSFNVRMSPEMHRKAVLAAKQHKMTLNQYVVRAITHSVETDAMNIVS